VKCLGCNLANKLEPVNVVFEDNDVCCFLDHDPYNEGHVLILPKNHIRYFDELDDHTAFAIMKAAKIITKVIKEIFNPDGVTICQNGGKFDDLTHFHMHVVPRFDGQNFADFFYEEEEQIVADELSLTKTRRKITEAINNL
jgi:histidine triad (HIT) family protein